MPAFPDGDLELIAEAAFGADLTADPATWTFTDLSDRVIDTPVTITPGVVVGTAASKSGSASGLMLLNDDGRLTPYLATSPWYPYVDLGTPVRLSVRNADPYVSDTFGRTLASTWGTPDSGPAWTGSGGGVASVAGGKGVVTHSSVAQTNAQRSPLTVRDFEITFTVSSSVVSTGSALAAGPAMREDGSLTNYVWVSVAFDLAGAVKLRLSRSNGGSFALLANLATGLTYSAGTQLTCHVKLIGARIQARIWLTASGSEPTTDTWLIDQTLTTNLTARSNVAMLTQIPSGNTNTLPVAISWDNITVRQPPYVRAEMYITDVRPTFRVLPDGTEHSVAQITLGGVGTRLELKDAPDLSPLQRSMLQSNTPPIAYWPLEDKSGATSATSAFEGQQPMAVAGPAVFAFDLGETDDNYVPRYGTTGLVSLATGARLTGTVPLSASTSWTVSMMHVSYTRSVGGGVTEMRLMEWTTPGGTFARWALIGTMTGHVVRAYNDTAATTTDVVTSVDTFGGSLFSHAVQGTQSGGNITVNLLFNNNNSGSGSVAGTIASVQQVRINPDQANTTASTDPFGIKFLAGHVQVHDSLVLPLPIYSDTTTGYKPVSVHGWAYEALHRRAMRLADEENIPLTVVGDPYATGVTLLNYQPPGAFQALMQRTVDSGSGSLLIEGGFGYVLIDRTTRYNKPADLVIDMATYCYSQGTDPDTVLAPQLKPRTPTRWTVSRADGSSATASADAAYRQRRGTLGQEADLDVLYDTDCLPHARWRIHLSVDGQSAQYPGVQIDLAANPSLVEAWVLCLAGARIQRTNQPAIAGTGTIDQVADSYSETIGRRSWIVNVDGSPASVWDVGVWDSATSLWDLRTSTLAGTVAAGVTTLTFTQTADEAWSSTSAYDLTIAGEVVGIPVGGMGARTGSGPWTQVATGVVRAKNGVAKTLPAGSEVHATNAGRWAL